VEVMLGYKKINVETACQKGYFDASLKKWFEHPYLL
jgi:hypothetical protein